MTRKGAAKAMEPKQTKPAQTSRLKADNRKWIEAKLGKGKKTKGRKVKVRTQKQYSELPRVADGAFIDWFMEHRAEHQDQPRITYKDLRDAFIAGHSSGASWIVGGARKKRSGGNYLGLRAEWVPLYILEDLLIEEQKEKGGSIEKLY
jgi:hypothetical protein